MLTDAVFSSLQNSCSSREMNAEVIDERQLARFWAESGFPRRSVSKEDYNFDASFNACFLEECAKIQPTVEFPLLPRILRGINNSLDATPIEKETQNKQCCIDFSSDFFVDGKAIGDVPTTYVAKNLLGHEKVAIGTYVDPAIIPGFKYRVRRLPDGPYLFDGEALKLLGVGLGYGKRITFAGKQLTSNDNYFWSDSHPEGYGFELEVVSRGDKFTLFNSHSQVMGSCVVTDFQGRQKELNDNVDTNSQKHVQLTLFCKIDWFETGHNSIHRLTGTAIIKHKRGVHDLQIVNVDVGPITGGTLLPGVDHTRSITVDGKKIGDAPTIYTINGLLSYEFPVIGTYIDIRIMVGFKYRVRPVHSSKFIFNGDALLLQSIGKGYGKRLTFEGKSCVHNDNYFWSDSQAEGYAFSIQTVFPDMWFRLEDGQGEQLGKVTVFRNDIPEIEESSEVLLDGSVKKVTVVDITCHLKLHTCKEGKMVRISGRTSVVKAKKSSKSTILCIETIGMDCQLNTALVRQGAKLVLYPEKEVVRPELIFPQ